MSLFVFIAGVRGQVNLQPGQGFVYSFAPGDIPFFAVVGVLPGINPLGTFSFGVSDLQPGDMLHYEMFENSVLEVPLCAGTVSSSPLQPPCHVDFAWQDGQGVVRLTMLNGSATLDTLAISYNQPFVNSGGTPRLNVFAGTIVPVPEPGVMTLALLCCAAFVFHAFRRKITERVA